METITEKRLREIREWYDKNETEYMIMPIASYLSDLVEGIMFCIFIKSDRWINLTYQHGNPFGQIKISRTKLVRLM